MKPSERIKEITEKLFKEHNGQKGYTFHEYSDFKTLAIIQYLDEEYEDENDPYKLTHYCGIANITSKFLDLVLEKRKAKL